MGTSFKKNMGCGGSREPQPQRQLRETPTSNPPRRKPPSKKPTNKPPSDPPPPPPPKCRDSRYAGLDASQALCVRGDAYMEQMDKLKLSYMTYHGLLASFARNYTWTIYLHFDPDWPEPVSAACVDALVSQFRRALRQWLAKLYGFEGFPSRRVTVKVFGFVFCKGVTPDASFQRKYGKYPVVTGWKETGENCPWTLVRDTVTATTTASGPPSFSPQNFYQKDLDLSTLRVTGNRTGTSATYSPQDWTNYAHPEKCTGLQTRYWHGTAWNAAAQRHYCRVGGVVKNFKTGDMGSNYSVLLHEMGHCFFLDDLYDAKKYPRPLASCDCSLLPGDSVMYGYDSRILRPLDHAMLRHTWRYQRKKSA